MRATKSVRIPTRWAAMLLMLPALATFRSALGTPQFARETKLPCSACHSHVPLLNEFGQSFYSNGFRLSKNHKIAKTLPLWVTLSGDATTSRSLAGSVPVGYSGTEVASYGFVDKVDLLYHLEYQPTTGAIQPYALHPFNQRLSVQIGQFGVLSQFDPRLDVITSRPAFISPAGTGPLGGGRFGPFAPGSNIYGVRATASLVGLGALPYSDGLKVAATVPFSAELPCGQVPVIGSTTGAFLEIFDRRGMDSIGLNGFFGRDGRRYYGLAGQRKFARRFYFEGGIAHATFLGAKTNLESLACDWIPGFDKALGLRVDDQDGIVTYTPAASYLVGGQTGIVRLSVESTVSQAVAPRTVFTLALKF